MKKYKWRLLLAAVFLILLAFPPAVLTRVQVAFGDSSYPEAENLKILVSKSDETIPFSGLKTTYGKTGKSRIWFFDPIYRKGTYIRRLDPIDSEYAEVIQIRSITVTFNGLGGFTLEGEALARAFSANDQVEILETGEEGLSLRITGSDSQLFPTESFCRQYADTADRYARAGVLLLFAFLAAVYAASRLYGRLRKSRKEERCLDLADEILALVAAGAVFFLILAVIYGDYGLNPDEKESRNAVRYYAEADHNLPPDIREDDVSPTIGTYGTTRLAEKTPYYFYAGKLFSLFSGEHMERLFGLCLGIGLALFVLSQLRRNRYLAAVFFLTPQVWYLYTYCTSDALDYVVSVLVLYQLACGKSMLNSLIRRGVKKKDAGRILLLGILFGHVLTAKANYYVILIYAFFMLLVPFLSADKKEKIRLLKTYFWIVLAAFLFVGARLFIDFVHYGFDKDAVVMQIREARAVDGLRPQDPPEEQAWSFMMYRKGISFWSFLRDYGLFGSLLRSAVGVYGGMKIQGPDWYYPAMGAVYAALYVLMTVSVWKKGGRAGRQKWALLHVTALISVLLVLYNAYFVDFQPQGRYLLPVFIMAGQGLSLDGELLRKPSFQALICAAALLSLYSFASGTPQLWESWPG